ncbi:Ubiquitin-like protein [Phaffia rhodozyma]|uniref:Ubiquitin-related modifier 1 n=1 Tax=Phaffia rhodozyma TaxID=264483 RepID=A0A0F7SQD5_PHARH|nr:Ubiquitin-like protein [Phaffia rhodozyma]
MSINGLGYQRPGAGIEAQDISSVRSGEDVAGESAGKTLSVKVEFGGGLDLLFSKQPRHNLRIPATAPSTATMAERPTDMRFLIEFLAKNVLQEREELFREGETVRPGILVLINDTDWELEHELEYVLEDGDECVFISTLHGG